MLTYGKSSISALYNFVAKMFSANLYFPNLHWMQILQVCHIAHQNLCIKGGKKDTWMATTKEMRRKKNRQGCSRVSDPTGKTTGALLQQCNQNQKQEWIG